MLTLVVVQLLEAFFHVDRFLMLSPEHLPNPLRWYELLTYSLAHSREDITHLLFNLLFLFFFGRQVEAMIGGRNAFFVFAAVAAVLSSLSYLLIEFIRSDMASPLLGASGIAYACLVAYATILPNAEVIVLFVPVRAWVLASILMAVAVYTAALNPFSGVAHVAHFGGGAFGFLFIRYRHAITGLVDGARARRQLSARAREVDRRQEMDRILEKISQEGLGSLSKTEKKFLESASRDLRDRR